MNKTHQLELFKKQCQEKGLKLTPQRIIIYKKPISTEGKIYH